MTTDAQIAAELNQAIPNPYLAGARYPASYNDIPVSVTRTHGKGNQSRNLYLHVYKPVKRVMKSPTGEVLNTWQDEVHARIKLYDPTAKFEEV